MNMPRQYKRNNRGISISLGQRQMNISKRVMYLLGNPDAITFVPSEEYEDWMILLPGDLDIPCAETGFIHYRRKQKKSAFFSEQTEKSAFPYPCNRQNRHLNPERILCRHICRYSSCSDRRNKNLPSEQRDCQRLITVPCGTGKSRFP